MFGKADGDETFTAKHPLRHAELGNGAAGDTDPYAIQHRIEKRTGGVSSV
jgi:hypothetical protein